MIGLRILLVVLGFALGIALLAQGHVVIGGLIAAIAVARGVLVWRWRSRVGELRARRDALRTRMQERRG
jgi:hypothetical protein